MKYNADRLWFLQVARAVACLMIVYVHWITFLHSPNELAPFIYQQPMTQYTAPSVIPLIMGGVASMVPSDFREVFFGLALFFFISGFVIPLSMGKGTQKEFLVRRILRIYPVVIATTVITSILFFISQKYYHFPVSFFHWIKLTLSNFIIVRDVLHQHFIDPSVWTLEIEIHFYLICFFIGFYSLYKRATCLLFVALLMCLVAHLPHADNIGHVPKIIRILSSNSVFISIMLVGTALFNGKYSGWSSKKTAIVILLLFIANKYCIAQNYDGTYAHIIFANHIQAFLLFLVLMFAGEKLPYSKLLDAIANVSYPLYLVHGFSAYWVFFAVTKMCHSLYIGLLAALIETVVVTYLVHIYVENKGIAYSKKLMYKKPINLIDVNPLSVHDGGIALLRE